jgi:polyketide synthase 12
MAAGSPAPPVLVAELAELAELAGRVDSSLPEQAEAMAQRIRGLVQEFLASEELASSRMMVITQGALATRPGERVRDISQAGVWGMVRAAESERPGRLILADTDGTDASRNAITSVAATGEPQIAIRNGELFVPRLSRAGLPGELTPPPGTAAWRLDAPDRNGPDALVLAPWPEAEQALRPGQVRVELRAAGLNFRDALISLGIYPGEGRIGSEGAGIVTEVAADVTGVAPGDRVMGLFEGIGPVAVTSRTRLVPIPRGWSFAQAAAVPLVFVTAYLALCDMARVRPGESVLIHAATGGVGMAALQLARYWQAEPYATASTAKWPTLDELGLDGQHIASSRTLEFEPRFLAATHGRGVNIVLNSLAGEFTDASIRLLASGGRFIELGKTDLRDPRDLAAGYPGLSYQPLNLADVPEQRIQHILSELHAMFEAGTIHPLPVTAWHVRRAREAVHHLARARHTGKLVLTFPVPMNRDGTVLIAGGTGTLGACVARHLAARHGVRHLLLASRSGPNADGAAEIVASLSELGAEVTVAACDTTDRVAVESLLGSIPARNPLTAVIHLAGQLDDVPVGDLTAAQVAAVFRPKVRTAWNLHELTREHDLSAFIMFSSVVGLLGLPGQANYAAANTILDALACNRYLQGLPATALAWGLWAGDTGMTRHLTAQDRARMRRHGVAAMPTDEALALFGDMLQASQPTLVPVRLDRHALRSHDATVPALLTGLIRPQRPAISGSSLAQRLSARDQAGQHSILLKLIRDNAAVTLGHANPGIIDTSRTFRQLGFDSLTAIEFRNRLAAETGLNLPATLTFDFPTPAGLAARLREEIVPAAIPDVESITAGLDRLEMAVARAGVDDSDYATIKLRLQSIVSKMDSYRCPLNENGKDLDDLGRATDEELFAALDEEIGPALTHEQPAHRADSGENPHGG